MEGLRITTKDIAGYREHLILEERSVATIQKYIRDIKAFAKYAEGPVTKETVIAYKKHLQEHYAVRSVNSMLASINSLFVFLGWPDLKVKALKLQQQVYCPEEKELTKAEYTRLCKAAQRRHNERLNLILQTICGTGIRVSELQFITVEAAKCGEAVVRKPLDRSNIWRDMKRLCDSAGVEPGKVFPHNLRHLFARVFYGIEKDIAKLADILGHSSINTTRIYIISTGIEHRRRMENMHLIL